VDGEDFHEDALAHQVQRGGALGDEAAGQGGALRVHHAKACLAREQTARVGNTLL
jgi:hypothetical protein